MFRLRRRPAHHRAGSVALLAGVAMGVPWC